MRKAILAWGVPAEVNTNNGSDFAAKSTQRLLASLGITAITSDASSPEQKGHVERLIRMSQHDAATLLPGFVEHNVADRKAIEGRKSFAERLGADDPATFSVQLTAAEMQAHVDAWAELHYEHRAHKRLKGAIPAEVAAQASHTVRRVDVRALDLLLAPAARGDGTRVKTGIISASTITPIIAARSCPAPVCSCGAIRSTLGGSTSPSRMGKHTSARR